VTLCIISTNTNSSTLHVLLKVSKFAIVKYAIVNKSKVVRVLN